MVSRIVIGLLALFLICGCQMPGRAPTCNAQIDWVNFIEVGSTQYVAGQAPSSPLQEADLGKVYAHVKFKVSGNVCDPGYRIKDGDAAFLEPGTPIYEVNGESPGQELAARFGGSLVAYRAVSPG
ncbi:MAG: hypothetical protein E6J20_16865 [Chloroflexi bacterium]|nr:MAG: hypothetical protein E6J20_16865 [Chloroflexota bacterium]